MRYCISRYAKNNENILSVLPEYLLSVQSMGMIRWYYSGIMSNINIEDALMI
jgi:hypothetical protein